METDYIKADTALCNILLCDEAKELSREAALRRAAGIPGTWFVPAGAYIVTSPIELCSGVTMIFEDGAAVCVGKGFAGDTVFFADGFSDISLCGGRFDAAGHVDRLFAFENGKNLRIEKAAARYGKSAVLIRNVRDFSLCDLMLLPDRASLDGIVLCGGENGTIQSIRGEGACNAGALIALYGVEEPIERVCIRDVAALDCLRFVHIVSSTVPIRDIDIRDLAGGCARGAVVVDEFSGIEKTKTDRPERAVIENITVAAAELFCTERHKRGGDNALIRVKTPVNRFVLSDLSRPGLLDEYPRVPTFRIDGQQKAPIFVSNIDFGQLNKMLYSGKVLIRVFSDKGFESEMRPGERLIMPDGGVGYLSIRHICSDAERVWPNTL